MSLSYQEIKIQEIRFIEEVELSTHADLLKLLPEVIMECLVSLYDSRDFVTREITKCFVYYEINPIKRPRNRRHWVIAIMRWLENAWVKLNSVNPDEN